MSVHVIGQYQKGLIARKYERARPLLVVSSYAFVVKNQIWFEVKGTNLLYIRILR